MSYSGIEYVFTGDKFELKPNGSYPDNILFYNSKKDAYKDFDKIKRAIRG